MPRSMLFSRKRLFASSLLSASSTAADASGQASPKQQANATGASTTIASHLALLSAAADAIDGARSSDASVQFASAVSAALADSGRGRNEHQPQRQYQQLTMLSQDEGAQPAIASTDNNSIIESNVDPLTNAIFLFLNSLITSQRQQFLTSQQQSQLLQQLAIQQTNQPTIAPNTNASHLIGPTTNAAQTAPQQLDLKAQKPSVLARGRSLLQTPATKRRPKCKPTTQSSVLQHPAAAGIAQRSLISRQQQPPPALRGRQRQRVQQAPRALVKATKPSKPYHHDDDADHDDDEHHDHDHRHDYQPSDEETISFQLGEASLKSSEQQEKQQLSQQYRITPASGSPKPPASLKSVASSDSIADSDGGKKAGAGANDVSGTGSTSGSGDNYMHHCNECGKRYSTSSNLARHRQTHRDVTDKKAKKCPDCNKIYVSMPAFSMHLRTHNQGCVCSICGKSFSRPWLLQGHLRTHTGEKPFRCKICDKAFADKSNLRAHIQTHSTTKPYVCSRCNKAFALKSYLCKHVESTCMRAVGNLSTVYQNNSQKEPLNLKVLNNPRRNNRSSASSQMMSSLP